MRARREADDVAGGGYAAVASVAFGAVTVVGKVVTDSGLPVTALLAFRFGVAAAVLFAILALRGQPLRPAAGEGARLVLLGVFGYAVEAAFFYAGLAHGTATAVTLLFFTYPVIVAVVSVAMGQGMPGWLVGGSLVAALAGVAVVVSSAGGVDVGWAGIAFALAAAVTFSGYLVGADLLVRATPSLTGAAWISASASLGLGVAALAAGQWAVPDAVEGWARLLAMGVGTAVAFVGLFAALRRLGAVRTAIVSALEPLAAAVLATAFLGDPLRAPTVGGGLLILVGAVAASAARGVSAKPPVP